MKLTFDAESLRAGKAFLSAMDAWERSHLNRETDVLYLNDDTFGQDIHTRKPRR